MDFLNPNNWVEEPFEYRIYVDDYANEYAIVDGVDYTFLVQWRWKKKHSRGGNKWYASRTDAVLTGNDYYEDGKRKRCRTTSNVYLHGVVMERMGIEKPRSNHVMVIDHANGNSWDCRRCNLRWTTASFNRRNLFGALENQLI